MFLNSDAAEFGLTEESLRIIAESRLRSARLYGSDAVSSLTVYVETIGDTEISFTAGLEYNKLVWDVASKEFSMATTWTIGSIGLGATNEADRGVILNTVAQHVDKFLVEYLRVNESWCGEAR